jgi:hypothetical protein
MPANVIRTGSVGNFIRPAAMADWFDVEGAKSELGI